MRSWSCQRMQSSTGTSTSSRVRSSQCPGWTDPVLMRPRNPSAAASSGEQPFGARRPCQAITVHEIQPSGPPAVASAVGTHQGMRSLRQRFHGLDEHPVGEPGVGTGTGRVRDDPAIVSVDRRREARPSRPRP